MGTFNQLRDGLNRAWESVTEGWHEMVEHAGDALTRFRPSAGQSKSKQPVVVEGARWGVLAAEMSMDDTEVEVHIEVPGMDPDNFDVEVIDDLLVIRGEKRTERKRKEGHYHLTERAYGRFERAMRLPSAVDVGKAKAQYKHGVLRIRLPRVAAASGRRIEVRSL